jgi:hypothetical protein
LGVAVAFGRTLFFFELSIAKADPSETKSEPPAFCAIGVVVLAAELSASEIFLA